MGGVEQDSRRRRRANRAVSCDREWWGRVSLGSDRRSDGQTGGGRARTRKLGSQKSAGTSGNNVISPSAPFPLTVRGCHPCRHIGWGELSSCHRDAAEGDPMRSLRSSSACVPPPLAKALALRPFFVFLQINIPASCPSCHPGACAS